MELDINPTWVSPAYFHPGSNGKPKGFKLFPDQRVGPRHYFSPSSRDWYAWYLRYAGRDAGVRSPATHASAPWR